MKINKYLALWALFALVRDAADKPRHDEGVGLSEQMKKCDEETALKGHMELKIAAIAGEGR